MYRFHTRSVCRQWRKGLTVMLHKFMTKDCIEPLGTRLLFMFYSDTNPFKVFIDFILAIIVFWDWIWFVGLSIFPCHLNVDKSNELLWDDSGNAKRIFAMKSISCFNNSVVYQSTRAFRNLMYTVIDHFFIYSCIHPLSTNKFDKFTKFVNFVTLSWLENITHGFFQLTNLTAVWVFVRKFQDVSNHRL